METRQSSPHTINTFNRLKAVLALLCSTVVIFLSGCATTPEMKPAEPVAQENARAMEETWGIRIESVRLTANGNLVDFRYRVIDPEKAASLFKKKETKFHLIDMATGAVLSVPEMAKIGAMKASSKNLIPDKVYFMMFANPGLVKHGSRVTVIIGDLKVENLTVE